MEKAEESNDKAKIPDSAYSTDCNNSQSKRSYSSKSMHSGSNSSGSSGYGGKPSTSGYSYKKIIMNKIEDTENNGKVSDSAYSTSCSNSQSRRSYSSKSMHSGSNSSGSSGYSGKPGYSHNLNQTPEIRIKDKEVKKKMKTSTDVQVTKVNDVVEILPEPATIFESPKEEIDNVAQTPPPVVATANTVPENMEISTPEKNSLKDESGSCSIPIVSSLNLPNRPIASNSSDGFSCVISMQDGIVMYTTASITTALGFPKDMWLGRSFIDFVHPRDRNTFASQITSGLALPKNVNGTQLKAPALGNQTSTMVCRIRRYRGLTSGFRIKDKVVSYMPFLLKFFFKNINDSDGQVIYLVIQATPFFSAFKTANEIIINAKPFIIRHSPNGSLEYIDPESVPYLGYLPQDIIEKDALQLYHPGDLGYMLQVYEEIVKEGAVLRSRPYRMMAQNGDYLKLETEWSSFINPWSRKLEFVIGKHFIIEGPTNPDVFQTPDTEKTLKISEEELANSQALRQNIMRVMNEVLTKPAEAAKQQMGKRCQDLASFMESLMEDTPKNDDELRLDIQDIEQSCFERESVMFGGMSPHHDFNDSKSSTETPVSYNQLNYNETLQRYFDSHEPYEDCLLSPEDNKVETKENFQSTSKSVSPIAQGSEDFVDKSNLYDPHAIVLTNYALMGEHQNVRLTESMLNKHNAEMEKDLVKIHREQRSNNKSEREKESSETRQKKKEHLARCNATFLSVPEDTAEAQRHGVKRASKQVEEATAHKHRCSSARLSRQKQIAKTSIQTTAALTTTMVSSPWPTSSINSMNTFILGLGIPQQMSIMNPISTSGVIPMYYTAAPLQHYNTPIQSQANSVHPNTSSMQRLSKPETAYSNMGLPQYQGNISEPNVLFKVNTDCTSSSADNSTSQASVSNASYQQHQMPCMMFGQAVYGSPFMYSSIDPQISYTLQQSFVPQNIQNMHSFDISSKNYEEACRLTLLPKTGKSFSSLTRKREKEKMEANKSYQACDVSNSSADASIRSTEAIVENISKRKSRHNNSDGTTDKTDEESSYSSFYSSFFKTDSGSNEESDVKNVNNKDDGKYWQRQRQSADAMSFQSFDSVNVCEKKKVPRRKIEPPWMEQVRVTSELIYKYQITTKSMEEVLNGDKEKLQSYEQPSLVNDQLGQLYLDLQLEGVAARLTLEEGITSSSSSGEETIVKAKKNRRRKREYSKLVMIYEEDAPLPSPDGTGSSTTS